MQGYKVKEYSTMWGIYVGEYKVLTNVPIAIANSRAPLKIRYAFLCCPLATLADTSLETATGRL